MMDEVMNSPRNTSLYSPIPDMKRTFRNNLSIDQFSLFNQTLMDQSSQISANVTDTAVLDDLYFSFKEITHRSFPSDIVACVVAYKKASQEALQQLHHQLNACRLYPDKLARVREEVALLKMEVDTWMLAEALLVDRLHTDTAPLWQQDEVLMSEKELARGLFERDSGMREAQLVVDWLELLTRLEDDRRHFACRRQHAGLLHSRKKLAELNEEDQEHLLKHVFQSLRAGMLSEACGACEDAGEAWRAVALSGWKPQHDDNLRWQGEEVKSVEGNSSRRLWRQACQKLIEQNILPASEKAILALLCGELSSVLPLCSSWHDHVWAHFKAHVDQGLAQHLKRHWSLLNRDHVDADEEDDDDFVADVHACPPALQQVPSLHESSFDDIFQQISATPNREVKKQSSFRFHIIQKCLILDTPDGLLQNMSSWCDVSMHPHLLRFGSHLLLLLRHHSRMEDEERVLVAWVEHLVASGRLSLVAFYTALLPLPLQTHHYACMLKGVKGTELRQECLRWAEEANLDVSAITELVVEMSIKSESGDAYVGLNQLELIDQKVTQEDEDRIGSLQWLTFQPLSSLPCLQHTNNLARAFLLSRKMQACQKAVNSVPSNTLQSLLQLKRDTSSEQFVDNVVGEFTAINMYLTAVDTFSEWFEHFHTRRPRSPHTTPSYTTFAEKASQEHSIRQHQLQTKEWKESCEHKAQQALDELRGLLMFREGGWLQDVHESDDEERKREMVLLRQIHLPCVFHLVLKVLTSMERWSECTEVSHLLASEHYKLYQVFSHEDLEKIMSQLTSCMVQRIRVHESE